MEQHPLVLEIRPKVMVIGEQVMRWICFTLPHSTHVEVFRRWPIAPPKTT